MSEDVRIAGISLKPCRTFGKEKREIVYMFVHMCVYVYMCVLVCVYVYVCTRVCVCVCVCV